MLSRTGVTLCTSKQISLMLRRILCFPRKTDSLVNRGHGPTRDAIISVQTPAVEFRIGRRFGR